MMSMCYRTESNITLTEEFSKTFKQETTNNSNSNNMTQNNDNNIYGNGYYVDNNNIINPFKIVEEEKLKLVKNLVKCLSKERAEDYDRWLAVGASLHNINLNIVI